MWVGITVFLRIDGSKLSVFMFMFNFMNKCVINGRISRKRIKRHGVPCFLLRARTSHLIYGETGHYTKTLLHCELYGYFNFLLCISLLSNSL